MIAPSTAEVVQTWNGEASPTSTGVPMILLIAVAAILVISIIYYKK